MYLVGVDIGTTGAKAALSSFDGEIVSTAHVSYGYKVISPDHIEQDAQVYWNAFCRVIRDVIKASHVSPSAVKGIGISGHSPGCLPLDKYGNPLYPCIIWMDRRATKEEARLKSILDEEEVFELNGNRIDAHFGIPKILWLKRNHRDIYDKAHKLVNVKDYVTAKLTGNFTTDYSTATMMGVAFDIRKKKWDEKVLSKIGVDSSKLPIPHPCDDIIGEISYAASGEVSLPKGVPVIAGTEDGEASLLSAGVLNLGDSAIVLGTSGILGVLTAGDVFVKDMLTVPSASDSNAYIIAGALMTSGAVYEWLRDNILGAGSYASMEIEAKKTPLGSSGLITLPYFAGERTPIWDPHAKGVIFGLSLSHNRGAIIRSAMEGIAFAFLHNLEVMKEGGVEMPERTRVVGGGAKSNFFRRILADVLGIKIVALKGDIGAEVGDAFLAGKGIGVFKDYGILRRNLEVIDEVDPDGEANVKYRRIYGIYKELYKRLKDLYVKSNTVQELNKGGSYVDEGI